MAVSNIFGFLFLFILLSKYLFISLLGWMKRTKLTLQALSIARPLYIQLWMAGTSSSATERRPKLQEDVLSAVHFIARGFRAGAPLRPLFDAAQDAHGCCAWESEAAQAHLLSESVDYLPSKPPDGFSFGAARSRRFARLLLDEIDRLPSAVPPCLRLIDLCTQPDANAGRAAGPLAHIVLSLPLADDEAVLRCSPLSSDVGLRLWEAGLVEYLSLLQSPVVRADVADRNVLELGSGLGLCASAFVQAGARSVVLSDGSADVVANLRENCARWPVEVAVVDVASFEDVSRTADRCDVETVFAADMSYDPALAGHTVQAIEDVISSGDPKRRKVGYIFATSRSEVSDKALSNALAKSALDVEVVPLSINADAVEDSSFGVLLMCNKMWNFCSVRLFRLT